MPSIKQLASDQLNIQILASMIAHYFSWKWSSSLVAGEITLLLFLPSWPKSVCLFISLFLKRETKKNGPF